jgi:predicted N-acetyltransferase YhbS
VDGAPVGCGALKVISPAVGSLKRMWVADAVRGLGIGRRMLEALEAQARALGLTTLRLETNHALEEAIRLYRSAGFREVAAFNSDPYAHHWFEKRLAGGGATPVPIAADEAGETDAHLRPWASGRSPGTRAPGKSSARRRSAH